MSRDKDRPRVIVSIDTDDGLTGWGECYNHGPDKALEPILDYLFDFIRGHDPRRIEYLVQLLMQQSRFPPGALGLTAISAIDQCLWDISAKALNVPVYRLLGGHVRDRVKVYAGVYTAPDPAAARDEFDRLNAQWGLTAFKLSPYRIDMHRHRWGEVVRTAAEYFAQAARDGPLRLRDRLRRACARSSRWRRRASSAMRSRPMTRCSSRSRCGRRISRPGAN